MTVAITIHTFLCGCRVEVNVSDPDYQAAAEGGAWATCPKHGVGCHVRNSVTVMAEQWPLPEPKVPTWARFHA